MAIGGVGKAAKKSQSDLEKWATRAIVSVASFATIKKVATEVYEALNRGAELEVAATRFDNLAASIGSTSDAMLGKLRQATAGMYSDAQLMASASQIISLGLMDSEEGVIRLATVVGKLGWDMNQVVLTFANNSKMRLDALGLSVSDVDERTKRLVATGMSMDQAFDLAVLEAGEAKLALIGDTADTTKADLDRMRAAWANVQDAFALGVAEGAAEALDGIGNSAGRTADNLVRLAALLGQAVFSETALGPGMGLGALDDMLTHIDMLERIKALDAEGILSAGERREAYFQLWVGGAEAANRYINKLDGVQAANIAVQQTEFDLIQARRQREKLEAESDSFAARYAENARTRAAEYAGLTREQIALREALARGDELRAQAAVEAEERIEQSIRDGIEAWQAYNSTVEEVNTVMGRDFATALQTAGDEQVDYNALLWEGITALDATPEALMAAGLALTDYSEEALAAALRQAAMNEAIGQLAPLIAIGEISIGNAIQALQDLELQLQQDYTAEMDTDSLVAAHDLAQSVKNTLDSIRGDYKATVSISVLGNVPAPITGPGTPYEQPPGSDIGHATGTGGNWLTVPPGFPGDSYRVGLTSGERYAVVPQGESMPGGGGNYIDNSVTTHVYGSREAAALGLAQVKMARRTRIDKLMGRA